MAWPRLWGRLELAGYQRSKGSVHCWRVAATRTEFSGKQRTALGDLCLPVIIQVPVVNAFIRRTALLKARNRQRGVIVPPSNTDED
jgi:hypothetical protein